MRAGVLAQSFEIPFSAHTSPAIHCHPCCALTEVRHIEYFHDHERIERMIFDGVPKVVDADLVPDLSRPGLGLEVKRKDAKKFAA